MRSSIIEAFITSTLQVSYVMLTFGAGSRKAKSGWSGNEFHGFQSTKKRRPLELCGIVGLPVFAKSTEYMSVGMAMKSKV